MIRRVRRFWPPGIRAQLTLGYTVVFGLMLVVIVPVLFVITSSTIERNLTSSLDSHARQIATDISHTNHTIVIHDPAHHLPGISANGLVVSDSTLKNPPTPITNAGVDVNYDTIVRVLNLDDQAIYTSPAFASLPTSIKTARQGYNDALAGSSWRDVVRTSDGKTVLMLSVGLVDESHHTFAVLQVGQPAGQLNEIQHTVQISFLLAVPVLLLGAFAGSYGLATRAFRPVRRLTEVAQGIKGGDLHGRVPLPAAHDDVRALAVTFNEMIGQLEKSFTQQRRFVADASHELRTPVAVIRSVTDVALAQDASKEEYANVLRDVNAEAERLSKLINTLLALARADEGHFALEQETVRLDLLVADAVASAQALADEQGLTLASGTLDAATVRGDTGRLIQVIMSLVDNALTYTPTGGCVTVAVTSSGGHAQLVVTDTGIGIGPDDLPHIFERFYRADPARTRAAGGSGLGLALADEIVRTHGGTISTSSVAGLGSTFTVTLPISAE